jgi:hypothetical protein
MKDDLDFVYAVMPLLAKMADGHFIDPNVRPKDKRETWTLAAYEREGKMHIAWWLEQPLSLQERHLNAIRVFAIQGLDNKFQSWRDVMGLLRYRPDPELDRLDAESKARGRQIRDEQWDMAEFDMKRRCAACGLFLYLYDERNNKRHEKDEICTCKSSICTCKSSILQQNRMKAKTKAYRDGLAEKKRIKKDPRRYK